MVSKSEARRTILVLEAGVDDSQYNPLVGEQMATGAFEVIDLRNETPSTPVASEAGQSLAPGLALRTSLVLRSVNP